MNVFQLRDKTTKLMIILMIISMVLGIIILLKFPEESWYVILILIMNILMVLHNELNNDIKVE